MVKNKENSEGEANLIKIVEVNWGETVYPLDYLSSDERIALSQVIEGREEDKNKTIQTADRSVLFHYGTTDTGVFVVGVGFSHINSAMFSYIGDGMTSDKISHPPITPFGLSIQATPENIWTISPSLNVGVEIVSADFVLFTPSDRRKVDQEDPYQIYNLDRPSIQLTMNTRDYQLKKPYSDLLDSEAEWYKRRKEEPELDIYEGWLINGLTDPQINEWGSPFWIPADTDAHDFTLRAILEG